MAYQSINSSDKVTLFLGGGGWTDKVVDVKRVNECIMCLKVLVTEWLVTCICTYAIQMGRTAEEKLFLSSDA